MEPGGIPPLARYFFRRISIQNHSKPFFTAKRWNKAKYMIWISIRVDFCEEDHHARSCWKSMSSSPSPTVAILSDTTAKNSAVDQENLKPYSEPGKRPHSSMWSPSLLFISFIKRFYEPKKKRLTRRFILAVDLSLTFLSTWTIRKTTQYSGKRSSFRHKSFRHTVLKNHHRNTIGPDAFDESTLVRPI